MDVRITAIDPAGPDRRARRLVFDASDPRTTAAAAVKELGLTVDDVWSGDDLETALGEAESALARDRALRMLGYRDRSTFELASRLLADGYPQNVVDPLVVRLGALGLLDDERFATGWVSSRRAAGVGRRKTRFELIQRGVSEQVADAVLAEAMPVEGEVDRARDLAHGTVLRTRRDRDRLMRRLVTRGFDLSTAARVAGESDVLGESADAADDLPIP